jgi:hypothetical protein
MASPGEGGLVGMVFVVLSAEPEVSCEEKIAFAREASRMRAARALFPEQGREKLRP